MHANAIEAYKRTLRLTSEQREVIVGKILGDGHLETQNRGRTFRMKIEHGIAQSAYVEWLYKLFRPWALSPPGVKVQMRAGKVNRKSWFQTVSHPAFRFYGQQFYRDGKKVVPKMVGRLLTPRTLAVWFMDDGSVKSNAHRALLLNTQGFDPQSLERLQRALEQRFMIVTKLRHQREGNQLQISSPDGERFATLIAPYVIPSLRYKFGRLRNTMPKR